MELEVVLYLATQLFNVEVSLHKEPLLLGLLGYIREVIHVYVCKSTISNEILLY